MDPLDLEPRNFGTDASATQRILGFMASGRLPSGHGCFGWSPNRAERTPVVSVQAKIFEATVPATSVRRKSRPL